MRGQLRLLAGAGGQLRRWVQGVDRILSLVARLPSPKVERMTKTMWRYVWRGRKRYG